MINFILFQGFLLYVHYMRENVRTLFLPRMLASTHADFGSISRPNAVSTPCATSLRSSFAQLKRPK